MCEAAVEGSGRRSRAELVHRQAAVGGATAVDGSGWWLLQVWI